VLLKGPARADPNLGGKDHENWKLKNNPECQDKDGDEVHEFADGYNRLKLFGLEAEEKLDTIGECDEIAETCTKIKKHCGEENKPGKSWFFKFEGFAQGHPETVKDSRHEDKEGHKKRELYMGQKRFGYGEKRQLLLEMILQTYKYCGWKYIKGSSPYDDW